MLVHIVKQQSLKTGACYCMCGLNRSTTVYKLYAGATQDQNNLRSVKSITVEALHSTVRPLFRWHAVRGRSAVYRLATTVVTKMLLPPHKTATLEEMDQIDSTT